MIFVITLLALAARNTGHEVFVAAPEKVTAVDARPLDLDIYRIPENPAKGEPEHWHFDLRYLYRTEETEVSLQAEEVGDHAWRSPAELPSERLTTKVALHLVAI